MKWFYDMNSQDKTVTIFLMLCIGLPIAGGLVLAALKILYPNGLS